MELYTAPADKSALSMCDRSVYGLEGLLEHGEGTPPALEFVHVHGEIGMLALDVFLFSGVSQMLVLTAAEHRKLVQNTVPMELHLCCQPVSAEQSLSSQTTVSPSLNGKFAMKLWINLICLKHPRIRICL